MRAPAISLVAVALLAGCGSSPEPAADLPKAAVAKKVMDHTPALMQEGLISSRVVPEHILGQPKLPGGSLGEYEVRGKKYQAFIVDADTDQAAALLLFDFKAALKDPEYISYMGGYFGSGGRQNVYVFAKKQYVAGIAGLPMAEADGLARTLASRLR
ncbi:MAG: hypothetical protein JWN34_5749 [Bryobacterales bacterium]|jgi:hypothetical protein|nr:hypothetical protein [Bryobacterales bacterium]